MKVGKPIAIMQTSSTPTSRRPVRPSIDYSGRIFPAGGGGAGGGAAVAGGGAGGGGGASGTVTPVKRYPSPVVPGQGHLLRADDSQHSSSNNLLQLVQGSLLPSAPTSPPPGKSLRTDRFTHHNTTLTFTLLSPPPTLYLHPPTTSTLTQPSSHYPHPPYPYP